MNCDNYYYTKETQPLTKEEFERYFNAYKNGDTSAHDILVTHNIRLVVNLAVRCNAITYELDDLVQIGCIGLMKAIETFDMSKNTAFATYASRCIMNEIGQFFRKNNKYNDNISFNDVLCIGKNNDELLIEDILSDDEADFVEKSEDEERASIIRKTVDNLPDRDSEIMKLRFGFYDNKCYTETEIASMFDLSQSYISRLIKRNLKIIENKMYELQLIEANQKESETKSLTEMSQWQQRIKVKLERINANFSDYSKEQILQALQTYISDLSQQCNQILVILFSTDKNYTQRELAFEINCSECYVYKCIKKITKKLESKSLKEELELILSQITANVEITKITSTDEEKEISDAEQNISESDNNLLSINLEQVKENITNNEYFNNLIFEQMLSQYSSEIQTIVILKLSNYSLDEISKLFNMKYSESEIIDITKQFLLIYKNMINNYIDNSIKLIINRKLKS